jgi:chromosome partitioning protein
METAKVIEDMLTTEQVAEQMQVERKTVLRWIREGKLRASKVGKAYVIPQAAVAGLITRTEVPSIEAQPPLAHRVVTAIVNQKGGSGKTTTAMNLGVALARRGRRVLLVDSDPQGALTASAGISPDDFEVNLYNVMTEGGVDPNLAIITTRHGVDLIPSELQLSDIEVELSGSRLNREFVLKRALDEIRTSYDHVLIDCPPQTSWLTVNALAAANRVLVPVECSYLATRGIPQLWRNIERARRGLNPRLEVLGILPTRYDGRNRHSEETVQAIRERLGSYLLPIIIQETVRAKDAAREGLALVDFDPTNDAARAYVELAREVDHV